jgi:hypothetical protein
MDRAARAPDPRAEWPALTVADRTNLNCWGRAYGLQYDGFTRYEAAHLAFLSLLIQNGCYADDRAPAAEGE